jgi:hypothetical protein
MSGVRFLTFILAFLTMAACAPMGHSNRVRTSESTPEPAVKTSANVNVPEAVTPANSAKGDDDWLPDWQVVCKAEYCPPQIGILVRPRPPEGGLVHFSKCTAFLVGSKWVMSAGHCDSEVTGYFITQKINGQKILRKLKSDAVYKHYVPGEFDAKTHKEIRTSGEMDVAIFEMEEEIPGDVIKPYTIAAGKGHDLDKLFALVTNKGDGPNVFQIEEHACDLHRHEAIFPFSLAENPDVITSFNCGLVEGNSGSPLLADPGAMEVEAVLIGGLTLDEAIDGVKKQAAREPYIYEKYASQDLTNLRCAKVPGQPDPKGCIRADSAEKNRRFLEYQKTIFSDIDQRQVPNAGSYGFQFQTYKFQVKTPQVDRQYEVFYKPRCRLSPQEPKRVDFPVENLMMKYDKWAHVALESVEVKVGTGLITNVYQSAVYGVQVEWPAPIGEFLDPQIPGLREQFGTSFNVALPICGS